MLPNLFEYIASFTPSEDMARFIKVEQLLGFIGYTDHIQELENIIAEPDSGSNEILDSVSYTYQTHLTNVLAEHGILLDKTQNVQLRDCIEILDGLVLIMGDMATDVIRQYLGDSDDSREVIIAIINELTQLDFGRLQNIIEAVDSGIINMLSEYINHSDFDEDDDNQIGLLTKYSENVTKHDLLAYQYVIKMPRLPIDFNYSIRYLKDTLLAIKDPYIFVSNIVALAKGSNEENIQSAIMNCLDEVFTEGYPHAHYGILSRLVEEIINE